MVVIKVTDGPDKKKRNQQSEEELQPEIETLSTNRDGVCGVSSLC